MSEPLRRIDYIRQTAHIPRNGLNAPPGDNPYADDFSLMPYTDILRLLAKYPPRARGHPRRSGPESCRVWQGDIARYLNIDPTRLKAFAAGDEKAFGRKLRRSVCRMLLRMENGQLAKAGGKMFEMPPRFTAAVQTKQMLYRVALPVDSRGVLRPTITRGLELPAPKQMPRLFADFALKKG